MGKNHELSIADILNRQEPLDWFESVAIVAGICSALGEQPATAMPAPEDIRLTSDGTVVLTASGHQADDAVLRLLRDCLSLDAQPPALRLFVVSALSSNRYHSPAVLEQALAYYERPGRAGIIKSVRARCLTTGEAREPRADANGSSRYEADKAAKVADAQSAAVRPTRRRRLLVAVGIIVCAVAVAAVAMFAYSPRTLAGNIGDMKGLAAYVAETGRGLVDVVTKTILPTSPAPETSAVDAASIGRVKKRRRARTTVVSAAPDLPAPISEAVATAGSITVVADEASAPLSDTVGADPLVAPEAAIATSVDVIDANEIVPPRLLDPVRLPWWASAGTHRSSNMIELAITETGKVARVRLVSPAVRMTDMMMLSAAKTWTFEPASQNGHPTPYTLMLNVAITPP